MRQIVCEEYSKHCAKRVPSKCLLGLHMVFQRLGFSPNLDPIKTSVASKTNVDGEGSEERLVIMAERSDHQYL